MNEILQVRGLRKTFRLSAKQQKIERTKEKVKVAVDDLSFSARRGEIFGLLGPNGAGKTTTLRLLATLIKPDAGDALVDGASIVTEPERVRERIGFLTSELKLEDFFTPNYLYDFFSDLHQVPDQMRKQRKQALFTRFGIDQFAEVKVADLSTGMKQKVSLVISIVHDPDIIIFDEPTNGLDIEATVEMREVILRLAKEKGVTFLVASHLAAEIEKMCDKVLVLYEGEMLSFDTKEEALRLNPSLEDYFLAKVRDKKGSVVL